MVLRGDHVPEAAEAGAERLVQDAGRLAERVEAAYRHVADNLRDLPVYNADLDIAVVGPRRCAEGWVGAAVTPWCMNLFLVTDEAIQRREGMQREVVFPSGQYRFTVAYLKDMAPLEVCSLFSPMDEFQDLDGAVAVATEALRALLASDALAEEPRSPRRVSRRELFRPSNAMRAG